MAAKYVYINEAIECKSVTLTSRKIVRQALLNIKSIGVCFAYKTSRNSEAIILKELDPKVSIYCKESKLNVGDKLEADSLYMLVNKKSPYIPEVINKSGRHKANEIITKEFTFVKITYQLSNIPIAKSEFKLTLKV